MYLCAVQRYISKAVQDISLCSQIYAFQRESKTCLPQIKIYYYAVQKIFAGSPNCRKRFAFSSAPSCPSSPQVNTILQSCFIFSNFLKFSTSWKDLSTVGVQQQQPISFCSASSFKSFHSCCCRGISWGHHDLLPILERGRKNNGTFCQSQRGAENTMPSWQISSVVLI